MNLENCARLRIEVPLTVFHTEALTLTFDIDLQSRESCGHDPYTSRSRSEVTRFSADRQTEAIALPPGLTWSVMMSVEMRLS